MWWNQKNKLFLLTAHDATKNRYLHYSQLSAGQCTASAKSDLHRDRRRKGSITWLKAQFIFLKSPSRLHYSGFERVLECKSNHNWSAAIALTSPPWLLSARHSLSLKWGKPFFPSANAWKNPWEIIQLEILSKFWVESYWICNRWCLLSEEINANVGLAWVMRRCFVLFMVIESSQLEKTFCWVNCAWELASGLPHSTLFLHPERRQIHEIEAFMQNQDL